MEYSGGFVGVDLIYFTFDVVDELRVLNGWVGLQLAKGIDDVAGVVDV